LQATTQTEVNEASVAATGGDAASPAAFGGACVSTLVVLKRQCYLAVSDPLQYAARFIMCPFVCCFFGVVYVAARKQEQEQVPFRLFYLWWILAIPPCLNIISIISSTHEMKLVVYEIKNGMYRSGSYVASTTLVQLPLLLALALATCTVVFLVGNWPWDNFGSFVIAYAIQLLVFESLAQLLAIVFANPIIGMLCFLMYWSSSIVFCGLVFRGADVVWPFRAFYYTLPMKWSFNSLGYDIYHPAVYNGAADCVPGANVTTDQGAAVCPTSGFYCSDASQTLGCYGRDGEQVLSTLHLTYESLNSDDERLMDAGIMLVMVAILKVSFAAVLVRAVLASDSPMSHPTVADARPRPRVAPV